jgi:hypothetical protein
MHPQLDLDVAREHQRTLLADAATWRVGQQTRVRNRIARRTERLERLQMRRGDQVARLRATLERLESAS